MGTYPRLRLRPPAPFITCAIYTALCHQEPRQCVRIEPLRLHLVAASRLLQALLRHLVIILYASYLAYDRPGLIPRHFLVFYLCSRVGVVPSILLAIPPYSRRHGFWAQRPPTGLSWWSQLLTLTPFSLPRSAILHVSQTGHLQCWRCTLSCPCCQPLGITCRS